MRDRGFQPTIRSDIMGIIDELFIEITTEMDRIKYRLEKDSPLIKDKLNDVNSSSNKELLSLREK